MLRLNEGRRALVVGAGIGGLAAALALAARAGTSTWRRSRRRTSRSASASTIPPTPCAPCGASASTRRWPGGYRYRGIRRFAADGRLTAEFVPSDPPDVPFQISMTRADLHAILTRAVGDLGVRIRLGTTWREIAEGTDGVTVEFSDGSRQAYDLMVGADGIRSQLRSELFGTGHAPVETGYVCWRMAVPRRPDMVLSEYWNVGDAKATVLHLNDDVMYLLVVEPGSMSQMPGRSEKARLLKEKLAPFGGLIAYVRDTIRPESEIHVAVLEEVFLPAPWYKGHVVLIGDAAHAVTPHLAQGRGWRWRMRSSSPRRSWTPPCRRPSTPS